MSGRGPSPVFRLKGICYISLHSGASAHLRTASLLGELDRPYNSNNIYVFGATSSTNFPTTSGAFQTTHGGGTTGANFLYNGVYFSGQGTDIYISKIASNINLVFEQYPDLKANQNAMQLQEEIVSTENKLAYAKQSYNDSIENYNANKKSFFTSMIVGGFKSKLDFDFPYWQLSEAKVAEQESYTVKL